MTDLLADLEAHPWRVHSLNVGQTESLVAIATAARNLTEQPINSTTFNALVDALAGLEMTEAQP